MDDFNFYKETFEGEQNRRNNLDNSVNPPIIVITVLAGAISYLFAETNFDKFSTINISILILIIISSTLIFSTIIFLAKSYNNLFRGFKYLHYPKMEHLRTYEIIQIPEYNSKIKKKKRIDFEEELIKRFVKYTDNHFVINDKRAKDLYKAKSIMIGAIIVVLVSLSLLQLKQILSL